MDAQSIIDFILTPVTARPECLHLAVDRGLGDAMKVEWWILAEMLARLIQLRDQGKLDAVEGEHKYPLKKTTRYEHCDLWWGVGGKEHWLEVKTVTTARDIRDVVKDIDKRNRLRRTDRFFHLSLVFPIAPSEKGAWRGKLVPVYRPTGLKLLFEKEYRVWRRKSLWAALFAERR
jgi:hypothetical protein